MAMVARLRKDTHLHSKTTVLLLHSNMDTRAHNNPTTTTTANPLRRHNNMDTVRDHHHHSSNSSSNTATMGHRLRNNLPVQA